MLVKQWRVVRYDRAQMGDILSDRMHRERVTTRGRYRSEDVDGRAECPAKYDEVTLCIFGEKLFMNDDLVESMQWLLELRDSGH